MLVIAASFTGLFSMQADYVRTLELEDLADAVTDLVTELDLLTCEAELRVNWTASTESHGLPRDFHGGPYVIEFTEERPWVRWEGDRVKGRYFPSDIVVLDGDGEPQALLEVPSSGGFVLTSTQVWTDWGLDTVITVQPLA